MTSDPVKDADNYLSLNDERSNSACAEDIEHVAIDASVRELRSALAEAGDEHPRTVYTTVGYATWLTSVAQRVVDAYARARVWPA